MPPNIDEVNPAAIASAALPFFAIGKPSKVVAILKEVPGTLNKIAVNVSPVAITACAPRISAIA